MYKLLRGSLLTTYALVILIPCMIVIMGVFKTDFEIYTKPLALPTQWNFDNFRRLFVESNIATPFMNSVIVAAFSVLFTLLFASLAAYGQSTIFALLSWASNSWSSKHHSHIPLVRKFASK